MILSRNEPLVEDSVGHRLDGLLEINCYKTQVCVVFVPPHHYTCIHDIIVISRNLAVMKSTHIATT